MDTVVIRRKNLLMVDWYRNLTASGKIIFYFSKHCRSITINMAKNFANKVLTISSDEFYRSNIVNFFFVILFIRLHVLEVI